MHKLSHEMGADGRDGCQVAGKDGTAWVYEEEIVLNQSDNLLG